MNINLIGLYGPSRAGKDKTAEILVKEHGFEQRAQAAAIRKILLGLNPHIKTDKGLLLTMQELFQLCEEDWDRVKATSRESVDYMIRLGQTCRDVIGYDVWLNTAIPSRLELENGNKIVISDVRQPNEYDAIRERGGSIWRLSRPGVEIRAMDGLLDDRNFDIELVNDGTLDDLQLKVGVAIGLLSINA